MPSDVEINEISEQHRMIIDPVGFIAELINNIGDQRDVIRELISNAASREVGAKHVHIRVYESDKGLAITVEDDGCGMNYTKNEKAPGRLDKFLNAAQGKQAGFESDEFGAKGLGTKLLYNSEEVEIVTYDGGENVHRVVLTSPRKSILEDKKLSTPMVFTSRVSNFPYPISKGTKITIKGWARQETIPRDFKMDKLEKYLRYYTVIGYTKKVEDRAIPFPEFSVAVSGQNKVLKVGFPFISLQGETDEPKTVIFGPISTERMTNSGKVIKINLKGGITTDTPRFQLTEETGGVWLSVNGIPYFKLPTNKYARKLYMSDDFVRFVVECPDIRLNMGRSDFSYDEYYEAFEEALGDAFNVIKEDKSFQRFYQNKQKEFRIESQKIMNQKKQEFASDDKVYVWHDNQLLLGEPESEYDTAALLWKLEGKGVLPFAKFVTLQYPGYQRGIDILVDFQEQPDTEENTCAFVELEKSFSSFLRHGHDVGQVSVTLCWKVDKGKVNLGKITPSTSKSYKYVYTLSDRSMPVYEISQFPGLFVGTKSEAKDYFAAKK